MDADLVELVGRPRDQLEFTLWYLSSKRFIERQDGSRITITVDGVAYFEEHCLEHRKLLRLTAPGSSAGVSADLRPYVPVLSPEVSVTRFFVSAGRGLWATFNYISAGIGHFKHGRMAARLQRSRKVWPFSTELFPLFDARA